MPSTRVVETSTKNLNRRRPNSPRNCVELDDGRESFVGNDNLGLIYIESGTKHPKIILDENKFAVKIREGDRTRWRCTQYQSIKCRVTLVTFEGVVKVNNLHNHSPTNPSKENFLIQRVTILRGSTWKRRKLNYASRNVTSATTGQSANSEGSGNPGLIYIDSRTETRKIILDKNHFTRNRKKGNRTFWRCTENKKKCKATLVTFGKVVKVNNLHNHNPTNPSGENYLIQQVTILRGSTRKRPNKFNYVLTKNVAGATGKLSANSDAKKPTMVKKPHWTTLVKARRLKGEAENQQDKEKPDWKTLQKFQQLKEALSSEKNLEFMHVDNQSVVVFRGHTYKKSLSDSITTYYKCRRYKGRGCPAFVKIYELEDDKIVLEKPPIGHSHGKITIDYDKLTRKDVIVSESIPKKIVPKKDEDGNKSNKPAAARKVVKEITSDKPEAVEKVTKEINGKIEQCDVKDVKKVKVIKKVELVSADNDKEKSVTEKENIGPKGIIYFEKTNRNGEKLIYEDYEYRAANSIKKHKYWECAKYTNGCRVRLILSGNVLSSTNFEHNHPPQDRERSEESLCRMVTIMLRDPHTKTTKKSSDTDTAKDSNSDTPCMDKETKKKMIDDGNEEEIRVDIERTNSRESAGSSNSNKERNKEGKKRVFVPSDSDTNEEMPKKKAKKHKGVEVSFKIRNTDSGENKGEKLLKKKAVDSNNEIASSAGDEQSIHDFDETMEKLMMEESSAESERDIKSDEEVCLTDENSLHEFQYETDPLLGVDNDKEKKYQAKDVKENNQDQSEQVREENGGIDQHQSDNVQLQENGGNNDESDNVDAENQHNSEDEDACTGIRIISYYTVDSGCKQ